MHRRSLLDVRELIFFRRLRTVQCFERTQISDSLPLQRWDHVEGMPSATTGLGSIMRIIKELHEKQRFFQTAVPAEINCKICRFCSIRNHG